MTISDEPDYDATLIPPEPTEAVVRDENERLRANIEDLENTRNRLCEQLDEAVAGLSELETQAQAIQEATERRHGELVDSIVELRQSLGEKS